jgi:muramidase (phage lysozyme)
MNQLMDYKGMTQDAMGGQIVQAIWDGNGRWASLPDANNNQPHQTWKETIDSFNNALKTLPECQ